ncbi:aspartate/tyrosine/aromatic aminotransferase [Pseudomonas sp. S37]|uniref:amino acid aminotransferase n=1 Tax=Pseudomonas sp. S37 TaxID=2767449 RepID=UPI00191363D5|nr:amino acid aminotransferase [Pseudomonas sp. S37]MBK4992445.1 aspartate/tyrosine/aromatic aminotransferase [Pseudomonas sp. S37]
MIFDHLKPYAGDPILSIMDHYKRDHRAKKVNLSVGLYHDEAGNIPKLKSVKAAKAFLDAQENLGNFYLPIEGSPKYRDLVQNHLFGYISDKSKIVTIQSIGGSGALRIAADFMARTYPNSRAWLSSPTWDNHAGIFSSAGFKIMHYPYKSPDNCSIDFAHLIKTLQSASSYDIIVLHACCHNPTGLDLSLEQWQTIFSICGKLKLIPLLDAAYLGLGKGFEHDSKVFKIVASSGVTALVANSFSKVFSLYGERVGSLSVICTNPELTERVLGQLKLCIRSTYSTPPNFGSALVCEILSNPELYNIWQTELDSMRSRLHATRFKLHACLSSEAPNHNHEYLISQIGMFAYTNLGRDQVRILRDRYGIYMLENGRLCIAGLNDNNLEYVAKSIAEVL